MNKIMIISSIIVSIVLVHFGYTLSTNTSNKRNELNTLIATNNEMKSRIAHEEGLPKRKPVELSAAYSSVINQMRLLESYSGTSMNIVFQGAKDMEDLSTHYVETSFSGVRGLPVLLNVAKFSKETDMSAVLNDVYMLERNTDLKVSEIQCENNVLIVKGEIYGL